MPGLPGRHDGVPAEHHGCRKQEQGGRAVPVHWVAVCGLGGGKIDDWIAVLAPVGLEDTNNYQTQSRSSADISIHEQGLYYHIESRISLSHNMSKINMHPTHCFLSRNFVCYRCHHGYMVGSPSRGIVLSMYMPHTSFR